MVIQNVTGWSQLMGANPVSSAYAMYTDPAILGTWFVTFLFAVYIMMLYLKTRNLTLTITMALIFISAFGFSGWLVPAAMSWIVTLLVVLFAALLFMMLFGG